MPVNVSRSFRKHFAPVFLTMIVVLANLTLLGSILIEDASAQTSPTIYVDDIPKRLDGNPLTSPIVISKLPSAVGTKFWVYVKVARAPHETTEPYNADNLDKTFAYEFKLSWDKTVLELTTADVKKNRPGQCENFLEFKTWVWNDDDATPGSGDEYWSPSGSYSTGFGDPFIGPTSDWVQFAGTILGAPHNNALPAEYLDAAKGAYNPAKTLGLHVDSKYDLPHTNNQTSTIVQPDGSSVSDGPYQVLAALNFKIVSVGDSDLHLYDTKLLDQKLGEYSHNAQDGSFTSRDPQAPVAKWNYTVPALVPGQPASNILVNQVVTFNASESYDPNGVLTDPDSYSWDFGDGDTATGKIVDHTFTEPGPGGKYTVNMTVTDSQGKTDSEWKDLPVSTRDITITKWIKDPLTEEVYLPVSVAPATPDRVKQGSLVQINVTVKNNGQLLTETFNVTVYYFNDTLSDVFIGKVEVKNVVPGEHRTDARVPPGNLNFTWNTAGVAEGEYKIRAVADLLTYDVNATNNQAVFNGTVTIGLFTVQIYSLNLYGATFKTHFVSNSTSLSDFAFNRTALELSFNATGPSATIGVTNVTLPKTLLDGVLTVKVDGLVVTPTLSQNATHWFIDFITYSHPESKIQIFGTESHTDPPQPVFTASDTSVYTMETIVFNATDSYDPDGGDIVKYSWDFGDGTVLNVTEPVVEYFYTAGGWQVPITRKVKLTVVDNEGMENTSRTLDIRVSNRHDVAVVDVVLVSPAQVVAGEIVSINVTVRNKGDGTETFNVTLYYDEWTMLTYWITGLETGSQNSTVVNWNTTNVLGDTYTIKAKANLDGDAILTDNVKNATQTILILSPPFAEFTYLPAQPKVNEAVTFDAASSSDFDGQIVSYRWEFGDGNITTSFTSSIKHVYASAGTFTVKLTVTDNDAFTDVFTQAVVIQKLSSTISLSTSGTVVINLGESVTLSGNIVPSRAGATVTLQQRFPAGTWTDIATATTDAAGSYSYAWAPAAIGTYEIRARWAGDSITAGDDSDVAPLTVAKAETPPPSMDMYLIAGAAIAVVIVVAVAVYFLKLRKPKSPKAT